MGEPQRGVEKAKMRVLVLLQTNRGLTLSDLADMSGSSLRCESRGRGGPRFTLARLCQTAALVSVSFPIAGLANELSSHWLREAKYLRRRKRGSRTATVLPMHSAIQKRARQRRHRLCLFA